MLLLGFVNIFFSSIYKLSSRKTVQGSIVTDSANPYILKTHFDVYYRWILTQVFEIAREYILKCLVYLNIERLLTIWPSKNNFIKEQSFWVQHITKYFQVSCSGWTKSSPRTHDIQVQWKDAVSMEMIF